MLLQRVMITAVTLPILLFFILSSNEIFFFLFINGVTVLSLLEFYKCIGKDNLQIHISFWAVGICLVILINGFMILCPPGINIGLLSISGLIIIILLWSLYNSSIIKWCISNNIGVVLVGVSYIGWLLSHILLIRRLEEGTLWVFQLFLITWLADAMAYLVGRRWGYHKLGSFISPHKSIEGLVAGLLTAGLVSVLINRLIGNHVIIYALFLGIVLGIFGQLGDLVESFFKRVGKIKDSDNWISGHGGILDVFDSLIFTAPVMYYLLVIQ